MVTAGPLSGLLEAQLLPLTDAHPQDASKRPQLKRKPTVLRNLKDLENYKIAASDGDIGRVKDFYFDGQAWVIRYLVVDVCSCRRRRTAGSKSCCRTSGSLAAEAEQTWPAQRVAKANARLSTKAITKPALRPRAAKAVAAMHIASIIFAMAAMFGRLAAQLKMPRLDLLFASGSGRASALSDIALELSTLQEVESFVMTRASRA